MRRWHEEATLMRRRWRYEFEVNHRGDAHAGCACLRGIGYYRKRTPNGHHRCCEMCHPKFKRDEHSAIKRALRDEE